MSSRAERRTGTAALAGFVLLLSASCVQQAQAPASGSQAQAPRPALAAAPAQPAPKPAPRAGDALAALPESAPSPDRPPEPTVSETAVGHASWYGRKFHGRLTASGEPYDMTALTAAHRTLPFGTRLRVTDPKTRKSVQVVVTDRGPATRDRILDLSQAAAQALGIAQRGVAQVRAEVLPARSRGS